MKFPKIKPGQARSGISARAVVSPRHDYTPTGDLPFSPTTTASSALISANSANLDTHHILNVDTHF
jgi:hypothetical protein